MNRTPEKDDGPLETLLKLLPGESTGAFLLVRSHFPSEVTLQFTPEERLFSNEMGVYLILVCVIIALTPLIVLVGWKEKSKLFAAFLTFTMVIWILNIDIYRFKVLGDYLHGGAYDVYFLTDIVPKFLNENFISGMLVIWVMILVPIAYGSIKRPEVTRPELQVDGNSE